MCTDCGTPDLDDDPPTWTTDPDIHRLGTNPTITRQQILTASDALYDLRDEANREAKRLTARAAAQRAAGHADLLVETTSRKWQVFDYRVHLTRQIELLALVSYYKRES